MSDALFTNCRKQRAVAREKLRTNAQAIAIEVVSGNFLEDSIPKGYDTFLAANVVHTLTAEQNRQLLSRVREAAAQGARFLLVDFWTNSTHTEPQIAALAAGEFLIIAGNGDVYSTEEAMMWLAETGWSFLEHKPLDGTVSLIVAEAV